MKFIVALSAIVATIGMAAAAPADNGHGLGVNARTLINFCTNKSLKDCDPAGPYPIYQVGSFDIPKGYTYVTSVDTPEAPYYTLIKSVGGKTVACFNGFTGAYAPLTKSIQDSNGASYTVIPTRNSTVDGVNCGS